MPPSEKPLGFGQRLILFGMIWPFVVGGTFVFARDLAPPTQGFIAVAAGGVLALIAALLGPRRRDVPHLYAGQTLWYWTIVFPICAISFLLLAYLIWKLATA